MNNPLPNPPFNPNTDAEPLNATGYTRAVTGNPKGGKVMEWGTSHVGQASMFNEVRYSTRPPNDGTLYWAGFVRFNRVNGVQIWPDPTPNNEGFDKAIELVGPAYRWTVNFGVRAQNEPAGRFSVFVGNPNPGHFNPECEVYDSYWQNVNGYGRGLFEANDCQPNMGNPFYAMEYDRWYAVVFGVKCSATNTGSITLWVNGTKILEYINIKTCGASPCVHDRLQLWGTYNQSNYNGPIHRRQVDAMLVADDLTLLQSNGYFADPTSSSTTPPNSPRNLRIQ